MQPTCEIVDLWLADLKDTSDIAAMRGLLDPSEIKRADRFVQDIHQTRFILRRAFRRIVLSHYLSHPAAGLIVDEDGTKKPTLAVPAKGQNLHFSTSHSGNQWLMAVSGTEIGADIEAPRDILDIEAMIARVCSAKEARLLSELASDARIDHFFTLWTVKEAVAKLTGEGLRAPLDAIDTLGVRDPDHADYHGREIFLFVPEVPGPAKAMVATFQPGVSLRQHNVSTLLSSRLGESGPPETG